MPTYKITLKCYDAEAGIFSLIDAETAGKAKYQHFLQLDDLFEDFGTYLGLVDSCTCLTHSSKDAYYKPDDDFQRVADYRRVPLAKQGTKVELLGKEGFIVCTNSSMNFDVKFKDGIFNCHPNHEMVYYDDNGNILYDFRSCKES